MLKNLLKAGFVSSVIFPVIAGAQDVLGGTSDLLITAKFLVTNIIIPLVFILALLLFFWGMVKFIRSEGEGKDEGKKLMIWGVIALFVMSSIWGLVYFLRDELGIGDYSSAPIPTIGGGGSQSNEDYWNDLAR